MAGKNLTCTNTATSQRKSSLRSVVKVLTL